jgi:hypothetical protein
MVLQARIVDPAHQGMTLQEFRDRQGVCRMLPLPQRQGLQSLQEQECVERAESGANIPQPLDSCLENKGEGISHPLPNFGRAGAEGVEASQENPLQVRASLKNSGGIARGSLM